MTTESESKHHVSHQEEADQTLNFLPCDPVEYDALEKKLVRKVDWRLMPVLIAMIVLKYVAHLIFPINAFNRYLLNFSTVTWTAMPFPMLVFRESKRILASFQDSTTLRSQSSLLGI